MGCWNGTCAITNLPIYYGEEVYVFFLVESAYDSTNNCYMDTYYDLFPLHFTGTYNDYGAVEDCSDEAQHVIDYLKENLVEMEQGENKYHDIPVKREGFNIEKLFDADHERRLFVKGYHPSRKKLKFTHITVKKSVMEKILKSFGLPYYKNNDYLKTFWSMYSDFEDDLPMFRTLAKKINRIDGFAYGDFAYMKLKSQAKGNDDIPDDKWDFLNRVNLKHGWHHCIDNTFRNIHDEKVFNTLIMQLVVCNILDYMMDKTFW
jgi:hypothetical protein